MQAFLFVFFRVCAPKGESQSQAFLAESVEPGDKPEWQRDESYT